MPVILGANSASGGYNITNSLRFDRNTNDYLDKTLTTPTNNKIFTWSSWVKRSFLTQDHCNIFRTAGTPSTGFRFELTSDIFRFFFNNASDGDLQTTQVFRDVSAWYHIVVAVDTTQATSSNRVKIYSNGSQITSFSTATYPTQNYNPQMNSAISHYIGVSFIGEGYSGYMSEINFIDGQALTPTSFGETDEDTGIWKPKAYTGTYGTNGFYLDFEDSANLGNDMSGNNNDFTVNNLTSIDQTTDTPTNNFATMNALSNTGITMTQGNLKGDGTGDQNFRSTFAVNKGKWYWEVKLGANGGVWGICNENVTQATDRSGVAGVYGIQNAGTTYAYKRDNGTTAESAGFPNPVSGNIMNMAFDADNAKLYIGINGTYYNLSGSTGNPATSSNPTYSSIDTTLLWLAFCEFRGASQSCELNFGNPLYSSGSYTDGAGYGNFSYSVPSGFYSLCTKNLYQYGF